MRHKFKLKQYQERTIENKYIQTSNVAGVFDDQSAMTCVEHYYELLMLKAPLLYFYYIFVLIFVDRDY